ncbi:MAG TPA: hypothetical protein VH063_15880 [Gaiellaceae bacterium]|nr:hypothetical protein [Gaiellaceae bacterium]
MKELTLFDPPAAIPRSLTDHQAEAFEHVREAGHDGIRADELGRLIGSAPLHCRQNGLSLLQALKKKGWVRQTKGGVYVAIELPTGDDFGEIPF